MAYCMFCGDQIGEEGEQEKFTTGVFIGYQDDETEELKGKHICDGCLRRLKEALENV